MPAYYSRVFGGNCGQVGESQERQSDRAALMAGIASAAHSVPVAEAVGHG